MKIATKGVIELPGHDGDRTFGLLNETTGLLLPSESSPKVNTTSSTSAARDLINLWTATAFTPSVTPPVSIANETLGLLDFLIYLEPVSGALTLSRNDVFLTFFAALLHAAQFQQWQELGSFTINEPKGNLFLQMEESVPNCKV